MASLLEIMQKATVNRIKQTVKNIFSATPVGMVYNSASRLNQTTQGGISGGLDRVKQSFQNPGQYNFYGQAAKGNLNVPQPFNEAGKFIGNYVQNRYIKPVVSLPENIQNTFRTDRPLLTAERGISALNALGGAAVFLPDPIQDLAMPAYDFLKGSKASALKGGNPLQNLGAGLKSASLENPVGLGEAITTNPTAQTALNIAELPLAIAMTHKIGKGQQLGFSKDLVRKARQSFSPEVKSAIGKFASIVESNPSANKSNLGELGDYVQTVAESLWGERVANLTNKQLKNAFDVLMYQVDQGMPRTHFPIGLNATDIRSTMKKSDAQAKLANLLNYGQDLINRGFTKGEVDNISYSKYKEIVKNGIEPDVMRVMKQEAAGFFGSNPNLPKNIVDKLKYNWNETFGRVKNLPENFQKDFAQWVNKHQAARTKGTMAAEQFRSMPQDIGMQVINNIEKPNPNAPKDVQVWTEAFNRKFNELYSYAQQSGLDINFLKNYITHVWKQSPDDVQQIMKSASKKFKFAKERSIPTYEQGIQLGLTPKYTNPSQIVGEYLTRLEKTKANIEFINVLKHQDIISSKLGVGQIALHGIGMDGYYAKPQVAGLINDMFKPEQSGGMLHMAGNLAGTVQDISMAGGVPFTPVNAFSMGQMLKEATAGRIISPMRSLIRSLSDDASQGYFKNNLDVIKEMQLNGIPIRTSYDFGNFYKNPILKKTLGEHWSDAFNKPTFERFIPQLQIEFFKSAKKNLGSSELASKATKAFYGIINEEVLGRPKATSEFLQTFFFAPKFRQSMMSFWGYAFNPKELIKKENFALRRFWVGLGLTVAAYDALNYKGTGKHLWENPEGKKMTALIPIGETTLGMPLLPSIATLPRMFVSMVDHLVQGNVKEAGLEGRKSASILVKPFLDVMANENYFGQEIYKETDDTKDKWKKILGHIAGSWSHPYLRETIAVLNGQKPVGQAIINATEAPIRFYKSQNLVSSEFWNQYEKVKLEIDKYKKLSPEEKVKYEANNQDTIINFVAMSNLVRAYSDIKQVAGTERAKQYIVDNIPQQQASQGNTMPQIAPTINQADSLSNMKESIRKLAGYGFSYQEILKHASSQGYNDKFVQDTLNEYYSQSQLKSRAIGKARSLVGQGLSQENVSAQLASSGYNPSAVLTDLNTQQIKRLYPKAVKSSGGKKLSTRFKAKGVKFGKVPKLKKTKLAKVKLKKYKMPKVKSLIV